VKAKPKPAPAPKPAAPSVSGVVVIDAGHQGQGDNSPEPIGPGSSTTKPKVADGAQGKTTGVRESVVNLQVSLRLRDKLQSRGVKVVMVRTSENVNISNSARAKIGNDAHAALVVRIHCDDVGSSSIHGLMTVVPDKNQWTGPILDRSAHAGRLIQKDALATTGAADRGVQGPPVPMAGFDWSTVPSVIVEMGLMSNPTEDRKLSDPDYQNKLATGISNGVVDYLSGK
jgi:N-acetylmuramoyl-L-alanine amidase